MTDSVNPARFRPSDINAWSQCPGKVAAVETLPPEQRDQENAASREGTLGHEVIAAMLLNIELPERPDWIDVDRWAALMPACQDCVIEVKNREKAVLAKGLQTESHIETSVVIAEDCAGTADVVLMGKDTHGKVHHLEIIDHKLGRGIWVSEESMQLQAYLVGAAKTLALSGTEIANNAQYFTTVIQPRHPLAEQHGVRRSQDWIKDEVRTMAQDIEKALAAAKSSNPPRIPGEAQCKFCAFKPHCPELRQHALQEATQVFSEVQADTMHEALYTRSPDEMSTQQLSRILEVMPLVRSWLNAVEQYAHDEMLAGVEVSGYKLVRGRSSRAWTDEELALAQFAKTNRNKDHGGNRLKQDEYTDRTLISPAQAEKRIKPLLGARAWKKLEEMISKNPGKPVVAPASDHREEIVTNPARIFEPVTETEPPAEGPANDVLKLSIFQ